MHAAFKAVRRAYKCKKNETNGLLNSGADNIHLNCNINVKMGSSLKRGLSNKGKRRKMKKHRKRGIGKTQVLGMVGMISMLVSMGAVADVAISVSWSGDGRAVMGATEVAGAPGVRYSNWNTITNGAAASLTPVYENGATATGVTLTPSVVAFSDRGNLAADASGDTKLFNGVRDITSTASNAWSIDVAGLSFAEYDVYVYRRGENAGRAGSFTIGDTTYYAGTLADGIPSDETGYVLSTDTTYDGALINAGGTVATDIAQGNYVKFSGLTGTSFTLEMGALSDDGYARNKVAGIQIVAVPEPATLGLIGLAGVGLIVARRFRV
jgi:hypothetical protein